MLFFLPLLVITSLYLALWRKLSTRVQHWRLLAVAVSLTVFLTASAIQSDPGRSPDAVLLPGMLMVIICTGLFSLWSFRPPGWLSRRISASATEPHGGS